MRPGTRTPVAMLVFNRPEMTRQLAERIAAARPPKVLVFGDGPRPDHPTDEERIAETRAVIESVDWRCEVATNYSEINLGTKYRPATGLDWVFEQVEEAIFLEDDCWPGPSFFRFCDELLERYRFDEHVMMVGGDNFRPGPPVTPYSYLFSSYMHMWGWATWRRAWQHYDVEIRAWPELRDTSFLVDVLPTPAMVRVWEYFFDRIDQNAVLTWDHQWQLAAFRRRAVCAIPATNLVSNIGFGPDATHAVNVDPLLAAVPTTEMEFPLRHPPSVAADRSYDQFTESEIYGRIPVPAG